MVRRRQGKDSLFSIATHIPKKGKEQFRILFEHRFMCPYRHFHSDFHCNMGFRKPWIIPFGMISTVIAVVVWGSTVSAQTGFGIQRLSNGPRPSSPLQSEPPLNSLRSESSTFPAPSTAAPTGKVVGAARSNNLFPRKEKEEELPPIAGVVRVIAFEKGGQSFGSGSYIGSTGEYGLILSNRHVVKDSDGLVHVHFPNGFSSFGAVIDSVEKWDLAVIAISKPPSSIEPIVIARTVPVPGEPLWIAGHGSSDYRLAGGRCVRYLAPDMPTDGSSPIYEIIELSVSARQGDSGGPILNRNGELAGVLFGSDMVQHTAGSYCGRVSQFLLRSQTMWNRLPTQPEVYFASIEKDGPKRQLHETVNFVPGDAIVSVAAPSVVDIAGSSSSSFGVRSNSRRYVQSGLPAGVSETPQTPSPLPSSSNVPTDPQSVPPLPTIPSPTAPIKKTVWTPNENNGSRVPLRSTGGEVVQAGLSTEVSRAPFAEDRSALNPRSESESTYRIIRENLRRADCSKKYAGTVCSPYTLPLSESRKTTYSASSLFIGVFFLTGFLVMLAVRLIRSDTASINNETVSVVVPQLRKRVA